MYCPGGEATRRRSATRLSRWPPMSAHASPPTVSVLVCAYTERRWPHLTQAIDSLRSQRRRPDEIVLVVDHDSSLLARADEAFPDVKVVPNVEPQGLSGSRNTGVHQSRGDIFVFLDDDAVADVEWLSWLIEPFDDPLVLGTGGFSSPVWEAPRPQWFPSEFLWTVGASWTGLPEQRARVRNPMGGTMAFRREAFVRVGGFSHGVGRIGHTHAGCEETEWAIRVQQAMPDPTFCTSRRRASSTTLRPTARRGATSCPGAGAKDGRRQS